MIKKGAWSKSLKILEWIRRNLIRNSIHTQFYHSRKIDHSNVEPKIVSDVSYTKSKTLKLFIHALLSGPNKCTFGNLSRQDGHSVTWLDYFANVYLICRQCHYTSYSRPNRVLNDWFVGHKLYFVPWAFFRKYCDENILVPQFTTIFNCLESLKMKLQRIFQF